MYGSGKKRGRDGKRDAPVEVALAEQPGDVQPGGLAEGLEDLVVGSHVGDAIVGNGSVAVLAHLLFCVYVLAFALGATGRTNVRARSCWTSYLSVARSLIIFLPSSRFSASSVWPVVR